MNTQQEDAKERILQAAIQLFVSKGYAATSVSEIVQAAGVTKPMLYYYYKNKEGLFMELVTSGLRDFEAIIRKYSGVNERADKAILMLFEEVMNVMSTRLDHARIIYAIIYGPPQGAPFVDYEVSHTALAGVISEILTKGVECGDVKPINVEDITTILLSILFFGMDTLVINCTYKMTFEDVSRLTIQILENIMINGVQR